MFDKTRSNLLQVWWLWKRHSGVLCRGSVLAVAVLVLAGVFLAGTNVLYASETPQADSVRSRTVYRDGGSAGEGSAVKDANAASELARYRVFSLKHITADKAQAYLAQGRIGTVSKVPGASMILVTAEPGDLLKATAIVGIIDSKQEYTIRQLGAVSVAKDIPTNDQIQAKLSDIVIGTFNDPPMSRNKSMAIIDIHNNSVVAIAPAEVQDKIAAVVEQLRGSGTGNMVETAIATLDQSTEPPKQMLIQEPHETSDVEVTLVADAAVQPAEKTDDGSSSLFESLLRSLEEAERDMAVSKTPSEPNIVDTTVIDFEPPTEFPGVEEAPVIETQPTDQVDLALMLQKLNALEAAMAAKQAPTETLMDKVVPPAEVNEVNKPLQKIHSTPVDIPNTDDVLDLVLPEKIPFPVFLSLVGKNLGFNILYDPLEVKGNITLLLVGEQQGTITEGKMTVGELYQLLERVLKFYGYVMTRDGNLAVIRKKDLVNSILPDIVQDGDEILQAGNVAVQRVFILNHIDTTSAMNLLKGMKLGINITEIAQARKLIVTGYGYQMTRIKELLEIIDKPGMPKKFRFRKLEYTMAEALVPKIKALVEQLGEISITVGKPTATPSAASTARQRITRGRGAKKAPAPKPPLRSTTTTQAKTLDTGVYLDFDERTNRILMIGFEDDLVMVNELIDTLDVKKQDLRTIRVIEIQHVDAEEVRMKLQELGIIGASQTTQRGRGRGGRISQTTGRRDPRTTGTTGAAKGAALSKSTLTTQTGTNEGPLVEEPQVIIIESTNSLLVNATNEQHIQIAMIIGYVDSETQLTTIPYVVYSLENQDPEELAATLTKLVQETTSQQDKEGKTLSSVVRQRTDDEIIIIPNASTYSLIVYASKKNQQWISALVDQLDQYRPQILLDVSLVEIRKDDQFTMDLDLVSKIPNMDPGRGMEFLANPLIQPFPAGRITEVTSLAGAGGKAFYADGHIQALLELMQKKDYGRVLARPKLMVKDNQEGSIITEKKTSIVREKTDVIPGSATQTQSAVTSVAFDTFTEGITLTITPHISEGDQLQLLISLNRTDFDEKADYTIESAGGTKKGPTPPDLISTVVKTTVTVPDGHTVILGGMENLDQAKKSTKIPFFGDLPIIGGLFRSIDNKDVQSRLYVFVKAHVIRPGENLSGDSDIAVISRKNREVFEKYEAEMQNYQDWPGIKPVPFEPVKILEVD